AHRVRVDLLRGDDAVVGRDRGRSGLRVGRIREIEDDVVGRERAAVVPADILLQRPCHRAAVGGDAAVGAARDRGSEHGGEVAVRVVARERLVEEPAALLVLGADREVRVEQGRTLPEEHLERTTAAALRRPVRRLRLRLRDARERQQRRCDGRRDAERGKAGDELAPRQATGPNVVGPLAESARVVRRAVVRHLEIASGRAASAARRGRQAAPPSRYQLCSSEKSRSQPDSDVTSRRLPPRTRGRLISGTTIHSPTTMSFILMYVAARLTGSSSDLAEAASLSYSGFE